jgi:hypothetical protein
MAGGRTSSWRHTAIVVPCLIGLLVGCHHRGTPILTPGAAMRVMETDRQLNDRANATLDTGLQDQHETGAAAQIDDASFGQLRQAGKSAIPEPFQESGPRAFVPVQYSYPAEFLGEWTETSATGHGQSLALFVKTAPADHWRAAMFIWQGSNSPDPLPDLAVGKDGYARRLSPTELARLSTSPAQLADDLASYWNRYPEPSATLPPSLAPGGWTTARNERIRQDLAQKSAQQLDEKWVASPGPFQYRSAYRTRSGDALVFLSIVEHIVVSTVADQSFVTPLSYQGQQVLPLAVTKGAHVLSLDVLYTIAALEGAGGRPARAINGYYGPIAAARVD